MKHLTMLFILILVVMACSEPIPENSVQHLTVEKSDLLLSYSVDTMLVITESDNLYQVENQKIVAQYQLTNKNTIPNHVTYGDLVMVLGICAIIFLIIGVNIQT